MFRLAGHLGMSVRDLLASMPSREISEWQAYERIAGPLGSGRADIQAGIIAATVANAMSDKGRAKPVDFIPKWDDRKPTPEELFRKIQQLNQALGGTFRGQ